MSFSIDRKQSFFVVQSGIVGWEEPVPVPDGTSKTVSVCASELSLLSSVVRALALTCRAEEARIFCWYVSAVPSGIGQMQRRRIISALQQDPPGFANTFAELKSEAICKASELFDPDAVDLNYLSAYRTTALIATPQDIDSASALCRTLCGSMTELGGAGLAEIRSRSPAWKISRILEMETHSVVQFICSVADADSVARDLAAQGVRHVLDLESIHEEIAHWWV